MNALVLGATGLCGGGFLRHAQEAPQFAKVYAILRREAPFQACLLYTSLLFVNGTTKFFQGILVQQYYNTILG